MMLEGLRMLLKGRDKPDAVSQQARADKAFIDGDLGLAVALTRELADESDPAALHRMGEVFEHGLGVLQDFGRALDYYEKAADAGHIEAWASLGDFYLTGRGNIDEAPDKGDGSTGARNLMRLLSVQPDHAKAAYWNKRAAEAGVTVAQARLGLQYIYGLGLERNEAEAERLFLTAAEKGEPLAQRALGMLYASEDGDRKAEYPQAERWFRAASEAGDHNASAALAMLIIHGHVEKGRHEDAFRLMSEAAEAGHVEAMLILGSLYRDGLGTARDLSVAETWFRRASVRGNRNATLSLGFLLIEALEPKDYISGASVFREAAEQGDPVGQYILGKLYLSGLGVPQDDEKAAGWLAQAAKQNLMQAIETLAALYAGGRGVEANPSTAMQLFERAAEAGNVDAPYHKAMLMMDTGSNASEIAALLEDAASRGSHAACTQLGIICAERGDHAAAAQHYLRAAELGSADGLFNLAFLRLRALDHQPADQRSGLELLEACAAQGHGPSLWALHNLYADGDYIPQDSAKAEKWLIAIAEQGSGIAIAHLAERLGGTLPANITRADILDRLSAAAEAGAPEAQIRLAILLAEGTHLPRDEAAAFHHMHAAAEAGYMFAQAWIGDVLFRGQGVPRDEEQAMTWYQRAAAQGHQGAQAALGNMAQ